MFIIFILSRSWTILAAFVLPSQQPCLQLCQFVVVVAIGSMLFACQIDNPNSDQEQKLNYQQVSHQANGSFVGRHSSQGHHRNTGNSNLWVHSFLRQGVGLFPTRLEPLRQARLR
jgi:hypothetical protein